MTLLILQTPIVSDISVEMGVLNCKLISVSRTKRTVSGCMVAVPTDTIHRYNLKEKDYGRMAGRDFNREVS